MIPRLTNNCQSVTTVLLLVILLLPAWTAGFFHDPEQVIAPINSAGLLINQLLINTANVSSLLDKNIDHIRPSSGEYPSIEERSDVQTLGEEEQGEEDDDHYLGSEAAGFGGDFMVRVYY